jgi:hypothetical protein
MKSRARKPTVEGSPGEGHPGREGVADEFGIAACGPLPGEGERPAEAASKLEKPQAHFENARAVTEDASLSRDEKKEALDTWEQDARQLLTASNEGMPGRDEGICAGDAPKLGEVIRAKAAIGEKPKPKAAH